MSFWSSSGSTCDHERFFDSIWKILQECDGDVDVFFLIDFWWFLHSFSSIFSSLFHAYANLSHGANRQAVARQGEAAAGLRAVDLSSDQRPMREDERSRIVQQATCAVVIGVGLMEEDWVDILAYFRMWYLISCVYYNIISIYYVPRSTNAWNRTDVHPQLSFRLMNQKYNFVMDQWMSFTDLLRAAWSTRVPSQCGKDWCWSVCSRYSRCCCCITCRKWWSETRLTWSF